MDGKGVGAVGMAALVGATAALGQVTVVEDAANVGLSATHSPEPDGFPGNQERMTGGVAIGDFNRDGLQDIYWVSGGLIPDKLFINNGDGTFSDEALAWGLNELHCGNAASVADYDGDGWPDIYVSSFGSPKNFEGLPGENRLYRNIGGSSFTETVESAGVNYNSPTVANAYGSAWGDIDLDGDLDLMVTAWRTTPLGEDPPMSDGNRLFENNGDGTFTDITDTALDANIYFTRGFQPVFVDMNEDLYPELLVAADFLTSKYYVNNGDNTFTDITAASGTGLDENGMGTAIGDFNRDGLFDWYVSSIYLDTPPAGYDRGNMFYVGQGNDFYIESAEAAGVDDGGWSWGATAMDLDHDGYEEIVVVNGWDSGSGEFLGERAKLFYNNGDMTFTEIALAAGLDSIGLGRCVVQFDAENDGDIDLLITNKLAALEFYRNETGEAASGTSGNWLRILFDTYNNPLMPPDGFNVRVEATTVDGTQHRYMSAAPSYLGTGEQAIHFGLDAATEADLVIRWPRGQVSSMTGVAANQQLTIEAPPLGDVNGDFTVGTADLLDLLSNWGPVVDQVGMAADLNADGVISTSDLLDQLDNWGETSN
jgi:hypothetical protein